MHDCPQKYGGAQCPIIDGEEEDVIIPLSYRKCTTVLSCEVPTEKELKNLPLLDIMDRTSVWHPHPVEI